MDEMAFDAKGNTNVHSDFVRIGKETNWTAVALNWQRTVALKTDGSFWQWNFPSMVH